MHTVTKEEFELMKDVDRDILAFYDRITAAAEKLKKLSKTHKDIMSEAMVGAAGLEAAAISNDMKKHVDFIKDTARLVAEWRAAK